MNVGTEKLKLWVDDIRPAPAGWFHIKSVNEFKAVYEAMIHNGHSNFDIECISLDHDAGIYHVYGGDYINILSYMEMMEQCECEYVTCKFHIHSMNPCGVVNMRAIIKHNQWEEIYNV